MAYMSKTTTGARNAFADLVEKYREYCDDWCSCEDCFDYEEDTPKVFLPKVAGNYRGSDLSGVFSEDDEDFDCFHWRYDEPF